MEAARNDAPTTRLEGLMNGMSVLSRETHRVVVALDDDALAQSLGDLRSRLAEVLIDGQATLVIDVSGVERLSSATIAALLRVKRQCLTRRVRVVLRSPSSRSRDILTRGGLAAVLEIEPAAVPAAAR